MNWILKYFIPHHSNDHKPHLFRDSVVVVLIVSVVGIEFAVLAAFTTIHRLGYVLSAIYPNALVELTNKERASENIGTLKTNDLLNMAAQAKAEDMASKGYFAHTSPEGVTPWHWIIQAGYLFERAGENLAVNFNGSEDVVRAWMNSPLHRKNIMNAGFNEIGIGIANGKYQGRDVVFVVQMFGTPTAQAASALKDTTISLSPTATAPKPPAPKTQAIKSLPQVRVVSAKAGDNALIVFEKNTNTPPSAVLAEEVSIPKPSEPGNPSNPLLALLYSILLSPNIFLAYAYMIAALFVAFPLMLSLVFELRRGHMRHILLGTALFSVLIILVLVNQTNLFGGVILA